MTLHLDCAILNPSDEIATVTFEISITEFKVDITMTNMEKAKELLAPGCINVTIEITAGLM